VNQKAHEAGATLMWLSDRTIFKKVSDAIVRARYLALSASSTPPMAF